MKTIAQTIITSADSYLTEEISQYAKHLALGLRLSYIVKDNKGQQQFRLLEQHNYQNINQQTGLPLLAISNLHICDIFHEYKQGIDGVIHTMYKLEIEGTIDKVPIRQDSVSARGWRMYSNWTWV